MAIRWSPLIVEPALAAAAEQVKRPESLGACPSSHAGWKCRQHCGADVVVDPLIVELTLVATPQPAEPVERAGVGGALMMAIRLAVQAAVAGPPLSLTRVWASWRCSQRRSQRSGPSGWRRPSLEAC